MDNILLRTQLYADVALAIPTALDTFQYSVPPELENKIQIGQRVWVTVRAQKRVGYVVGLTDKKIVEQPKSIDAVIDESPILDERFLKLTAWMAEYYLCSWGQAIESALPAPFKKGKWLMKSRVSARPVAHNPEFEKALQLTPSQQNAFQAIFEKIRARRFAQFLLYGVTGSGKTEIYMQLIETLLQESRGSIVLVPEISLTPQTVDRFQSRFKNSLAVIHSRVSQARRVEEWHRIRKGEVRVVIGARSGVFSPVQNLGLIVIDEEHDGSYKQEETPRYQTRNIAAKRCELENACLLLGSATPSLESFFASSGPSVQQLELPERIEQRPLPAVEIIDMRREPRSGRNERIFSKRLEQCVRESLAHKEQVMLFLNRRGFSTHLYCSACGYVMQCPRCRISLVYHFDKGSLYCHLCHARQIPARLCPSCQKGYLHYFGIGTQKVEEEACRLFPEARIARMDSDSTKKKDSHATVLASFKKHETQILIGTQMIAKGHDFPNVSLVGVISADTALHLADFRAAERTFSLLTQVAGRAGRGSVPGRVVIQTYVPTHYSIELAKTHDYLAFYEKEIAFRRELTMPPFSHLVKVVLSGRAEKEVMKQMLTLRNILKERTAGNAIEILGPAPCLVSKERGLYRWNLFLKAKSVDEIAPVIKESFQVFKKSKTFATIDVDPQ